MPIMSQRGYARHRGVAHRAVQKAIESGRITTVDGTPGGKIDSAVADRQWAENTSHSHLRQPTKREKEGGPAAPEAPEPDTAPAPIPPIAVPAPAPEDTSTPGATPRAQVRAEDKLTLNQASAEEKKFKALIAELEYEERMGLLVRAAEVEAGWAKIVALSRTKVLGLPSKIKSRLPHLTKADVLVVEELCREALEELAGAEG